MEILKILLSISLSFAVVSATSNDMCLTSHNKLRALHVDTPALIWSASLASAAQAWADKLAASNTFYHDSNRGAVGENIYRLTGPRKASCAEAVLGWHSEYKNYDYDYPFSGSTGLIGHFTQVVWKSSRRLGAGIASYQSGSNIETIIVARYSPAGNLYNKAVYIENVKPMKAFAKVPSKYDLDPSLCTDASGQATCNEFSSYGYCNPSNRYYNAMEFHCTKTCKFC